MPPADSADRAYFLYLNMSLFVFKQLQIPHYAHSQFNSGMPLFDQGDHPVLTCHAQVTQIEQSTIGSGHTGPSRAR